MVGRFLIRALTVCALSMFVVAHSGCEAPKPAAGPGHTHDHEDLAIGNFSESVGTLRTFHDKIKTAFEAGKPDDAHDALHEIGEVLTALEKQAPDIAPDKAEGAKAAVKALFDGYTKIDKAMHEGEEVKYADLGEELSKNVAALEAAK